MGRPFRPVASNPRPREKPSKPAQTQGLIRKAGARIDRLVPTIEQASSAPIGAIGGQLPPSNIHPPPSTVSIVSTNDTAASVEHVVAPAPSPGTRMASSASPAASTAVRSAAPPQCHVVSPSPSPVADGSARDARSASFFRLIIRLFCFL
ncbi:hypothetical protein K488DRAFT_89764 [Vararia minispora EC-137]|uniref:Uncharacterized protein n=1 Tax=Vararia minispora EC-137 TaxID=1314806 RepID=A0ACB8QAX9_9AGAM|nr:hypothetical protein K488DRAFT_89764 [Vararia minispora EC-137]